MNVFYEEEGALKVGNVLADSVSSLQVEAPHGKRSKIKAVGVLLRFEDPGIGDFMARAQQAADALDLDFLWECSSGEEFSHDALARDYYGRAPTAVEAAGVLLRLHGAPMYFYKRGRGRYKAAPAEALKAALASVERKKQEAARREAYLAQLKAGELPREFQAMLPSLLYKPDRNTIEAKALEEAAALLKLAPARVIERCGALPSTHDYHLQRFLFEHFPRSAEFELLPAPATPADLPLSDAAAFSIDDVSTTEIDDAFSVTPLENGNVRVGIHIAAPVLGIAADTPLDAVARERLSTVYFPGGKITMLPPAAIEQYTLSAYRECAAVSLYTELTLEHEVIRTETRVERVRIVDNLRHHALDPLFDPAAAALGVVDHLHGPQLIRLWRWAGQLNQARRGDAPEGVERAEYVFHVEDARVQIVRRSRGTPIDTVVSELMIYANSHWGRTLAESETAAIYRVQGGGKVRMSTVPSSHAGLGVEHYAWSTSPLRRYVDLVNQRQIAALARGEPPAYAPKDARLPAIMREFESAYDAYGEFQRDMERYWSLRWLEQEHVESATATVLRDNLCRFDELPLVVRVASLPQLPSGARVLLDVSDIDLLALTLHCEFRSRIEDTGEPTAAAAAGQTLAASATDR